MFSKAKTKGKQKETREAFTEVKDVAEPQRETVNRRATGQKQNGRPKSGGQKMDVPSIISSDMVIKGSVESSGEIQFDGQIEGDLHAHGLVVGEGANVVGEIVASKVRVCGHVEGAIRAVQVELSTSATVRGDIMHTSLSIENGAKFEGKCRHSDNPTTEKFDNVARRKPLKHTPSPAQNAAAESSYEDEGVEPVETTEPQAPAASPNAALMPSRKSTHADRSFVKRPASVDLR
ncbi:MAG: polymer-forming cytoskeletal protein [Pseudomonadota bacterium]